MYNKIIKSAYKFLKIFHKRLFIPLIKAPTRQNDEYFARRI